MRGLLAAAALIAATVTSPAFADCSSEVALAINSQGKQKFVRKVTNMITERGPVKMVVEYITPDRMRQVLTPLTEDKPVESIVVGDKAWTNSGAGWQQSPPAEAEQLVTFMIRSIAQVYQEVGKFECIGTEFIGGKELRGYRGLDAGPKDLSKKPQKKTENEAERLVYLDPKTGLPARSMLVRKGNRKVPLFQEVYSYPEDLKIDPPKVAKPK